MTFLIFIFLLNQFMYFIGFYYEGKVRSTPRKISGIKTLIFELNKFIALISNVSRSRYEHNQTKNWCKITINTEWDGKQGRKKLTSPRDGREIRNICVQNGTTFSMTIMGQI